MLQISSPNLSPAKSSLDSVTSSWVATSAVMTPFSILSPLTLNSALDRARLSPRQHENGTSPDGLRAVATRPRSRARRESAISSADDPTSAFVVRCWRRAELSALNAPSSAATRCAAPLPRRHARRRDGVLAERGSIGAARRGASQRRAARRERPSRLGYVHIPSIATAVSEGVRMRDALERNTKRRRRSNTGGGAGEVEVRG